MCARPPPSLADPFPYGMLMGLSSGSVKTVVAMLEANPRLLRLQAYLRDKRARATHLRRPCLLASLRYPCQPSPLRHPSAIPANFDPSAIPANEEV